MQAKWQIDKRIPIVVVFIVLTQTMTFAYYSGRLVGKIEALESNTARHAKAIELLQGANLEMQKTLIKIEDKVDALTSRSKKVNFVRTATAYAN